MKVAVRLNNIQALRAFAAVAVVVFHTGFAFPHMRQFGSFGVDVFFVISGFIMARILDPATPASGDFFFRRRLLRIVPPYWFFTLLLFFVALRAPQLMGATRASVNELLESLFFIPFPKVNGVMEPLLFVGWSLNYEMLFYFVLAVGLLINRRNAVWIGAAIVVAAMLAFAPFAADDPLARFYSRAISVEFVLGILSYYLCRAIPPDHARALRLPALLVCIASAALLIAVQGVFPPFRFPFDLHRVLTFGALSFFLVTGAGLLSQAGWDTDLAWLVLIGDASYILYLVHAYCEYSLERIFSGRLHWLSLSTASGVLISVTVSILVAVFIHLYVERPVHRYLNRRFGGARKVARTEGSVVATASLARP